MRSLGRAPSLDVVFGGDVATMEALAAAAILPERLPDLRPRFVDVVDLCRMQPSSEHPNGSTEREFDSLFATGKPVIFNFHGYPWLMHKLACRFKGHEHGTDRAEIADRVWPYRCPRPAARGPSRAATRAG